MNGKSYGIFEEKMTSLSVCTVHLFQLIIIVTFKVGMGEGVWGCAHSILCKKKKKKIKYIYKYI